MQIAIFGPNLRDQSKGQFIVHAADCRDCHKLRHEAKHTLEAKSRREAVEFIFDPPSFGPDAYEAGLPDFYFCPCLRPLPA